MRIGIDISQIVYEGTGVARYVRALVAALVSLDTANEYVLFGASLRRHHVFREFADSLNAPNVSLKTFPIPPTVLDIMWNVLHIVPIEWLTGPLDMFWSSDWTQPPLVRARGVTTIHDVSPIKFPKEHAANIVAVHKRRLYWAIRECAAFFCDSKATRDDMTRLFHLPSSALHVVYPGFRPL